MARTQVETPQEINTIEDAENALSEIGSLKNKLENIDQKGTEKIGSIKAKMAADGESSRARIKQLEDALGIFAKVNRDKLFNGKQSLPLTFGVLNFRKATKIKTKKSTLELLKKMFGGKGVNVKENIDKDELSKWTPEDLATVDAAKVQEETFGYDVNREEVNKRLLKQGV